MTDKKLIGKKVAIIAADGVHPEQRAKAGAV